MSILSIFKGANQMNPTTIILIGLSIIIIIALGVIISPWVWLGAALGIAASIVCIAIEFEVEA